MPRQVLFFNHDGLYEGQWVTPTCPRTPDRKDTGDKVDPLCWLRGAFAPLIPYSRGVLWFILLYVINLNLFLFLPHPPFLPCALAPSFVPVFLSPAAAVDVLKHEVIFSVVRLAATCIICLGFLLLLLPEEWDSVTLRFLANIADKKSEEHGEELTESSVNTRSRSRANGAVSIPLAWHGQALLVASVNQSWSCVCSCSLTAHPGDVAGCSVHMDSLIRKAGSIFMNFKTGDTSESPPLHCRRGNREHLWILQNWKGGKCYLLSWSTCHAQPLFLHAPKPRAVCPPLTCSADCILWI